eukprot:TRINITY_DN2328_c0_g1_i3.p1 TRINITY_DN2328_c0_g1~~TRINITY_DN2328_c0_g1_i3.p1  ORF type:complete len:420 (-),score=123.83 TRINITY_DN2328_c0_g1_i3:220-1479(-)
MEEKAAASYYDDLARRGEGAAKFKQGLGYSTSTDGRSSKGSVHSSLRKFVKAASPRKAEAIAKETQIENIREKLKKKDRHPSESNKEVRPLSTNSRSEESKPLAHSNKDSDAITSTINHRSRSRLRERHHQSRSVSDKQRRHRSRSRDRKEREISRNRRHSPRQRDSQHHRSYSSTEREKEHDHYKKTGYRSSSRSSSRSEGTIRERKKRRSISPSRSEDDGMESKIIGRKEKSTAHDSSEHVSNHESMTVAERVKTKMRMQLSQAVSKESFKGSNENWERFQFNKEAPLDDAVDEACPADISKDDTAFLKNMGTTFSASVAQANREVQIKAAHEAAIFGASVTSNPTFDSDNDIPASRIDKENDDIMAEHESKVDEDNPKGNVHRNNILSEQVYAMHQGSWRDRARKLREQKSASLNS